MINEFLDLDPAPELTSIMASAAPGYGIEIRSKNETKDGEDYIVIAARTKFSDGFVYYACELVPVERHPITGLGNLLETIKSGAWSHLKPQG